MLSSNIPKKKQIATGGEIFNIGDRVRILYTKWKGGIIGVITDISSDSVRIKTGLGEDEIPFSKVWKMRKAKENESFDTVPYFDAEEKEFWRTHWITKNGIARKEKLSR